MVDSKTAVASVLALIFLVWAIATTVLYTREKGTEESEVEATTLPPSPVAAVTRKLQIIHSSDNESDFQDVDTLEPKVVHYSAILNGLHKIYSPGFPSIHVTAGDLTLPGPFYQAAAEVESLGGKPGLGDIVMFNAMGLDANGLGNHEFDGGIDEFANMLSVAEFPMVAVNLDFSAVTLKEDTPSIKIAEDGLECAAVGGSVVKSCYVDVGSFKVGIIGRAPAGFFQVIEDPENTLPGLDFVGGRDNVGEPLESAIPMVLEQVGVLEGQGIDIIILLDHAQDWTADPLSANKLEGIDIIVAAGSTGFMASDFVDGPFNALRDGDTAEAMYPTIRGSAEGNMILVVNTEQLWRYVGHLIAEFDSEGKIVGYETYSGPISTTESAVSDFSEVLETELLPLEAVESTLTALQETEIIVQGYTRIGTTAYYLNGGRASVRTTETNLARITADSTLWGGNKYLASINSTETVDVALKNGGGIRANIPGPAITRIAIGKALAFNNKLTILRMTVGQIIATFENAVSKYPAADGRFPQVSGMTIAFDPSKEGIDLQESLDFTSRVVDLTIGDTVVVAGGAIVADPSLTFVLATNSFTARGGDGYTALAAAEPIATTTTGEQLILEEYIVEVLGGEVDVMDPPMDPYLTMVA